LVFAGDICNRCSVAISWIQNLGTYSKTSIPSCDTKSKSEVLGLDILNERDFDDSEIVLKIIKFSCFILQAKPIKRRFFAIFKK
jgi:hypothetical protein